MSFTGMSLGFGTAVGKGLTTDVGRSGKRFGSLLFPRGGATIITVKQAGQVMAGTRKRSQGRVCGSLGWHNKTWEEFLAIVHACMGIPERKILTIPTWMIAMNGKSMPKELKKKGLRAASTWQSLPARNALTNS